METNMEDIDKLIKETLTEEEAKFYDELDEQNVFSMVIGLFKGKNGWMITLMSIMNLIFLGLFIYCVVQFLETDDVQSLIKWGFGGISLLIGISILKVFAWMQMDKNTIMRELKRLELQVSSLSGRTSE
ncbi:DUF6768 family protein [Flavivirga jejuensis]|uniref:Superfamily III holin-X n=1 Tax=Flavivirga jejuensis TaxID=870487 RepID=A0ABT8WL73_9FLAO|nr:DUF6768 family protein [Flavivirga jejuensis]MDO5973912.1 hypothetical protein [Flavivirga jejuensis]